MSNKPRLLTMVRAQSDPAAAATCQGIWHLVIDRAGIAVYTDQTGLDDDELETVFRLANQIVDGKRRVLNR